MYSTWEELKEKCEACKKCELCKTRTNVVFGVGNKDSKILFIGEGPGENEDLLGEPFVGRGGKLLDKMLEAVDLDRNNNIYIANIVKCRPPKNRDPLPNEQESCKQWLRNQVYLIKPKIIVCLGRVAAKVIINPNIRITKEHGVFFYKEKGKLFEISNADSLEDKTLLMATLHPAALLRNPHEKPGALEDFFGLREMINRLKLS